MKIEIEPRTAAKHIVDRVDAITQGLNHEQERKLTDEITTFLEKYQLKAKPAAKEGA